MGEGDEFGAAGIVTHIMNVEEIARAMVSLFTGTFLVRTACITVKNICPVQRCSIPVFDLSGIGKFTPVVSQDHREQPVKILCAKDCVKRIKYPDD